MIVEGRPTLGYFITDFGFMRGHDGTYRYVFTNCMEEDAAVEVTVLRPPLLLEKEGCSLLLHAHIARSQ